MEALISGLVYKFVECMERTNFYFNDTWYLACYKSNTLPTTVSVRGSGYIPVFCTIIGLRTQNPFHFLLTKGEIACFLVVFS